MEQSEEISQWMVPYYLAYNELDWAGFGATDWLHVPAVKLAISKAIDLYKYTFFRSLQCFLTGQF